MKKWLSWKTIVWAVVLSAFFNFGLQFISYLSIYDKDQGAIIELLEQKEKLQGTILYLSQQLYETDEFIFGECAGELVVTIFHATKSEDKHAELR